jgi:hypothetical protein
MMAWLKANRLLIVVVSLIGSVAGLGFSASDLHDELKRKKLIKR